MKELKGYFKIGRGININDNEVYDVYENGKYGDEVDLLLIKGNIKKYVNILDIILV